MARNSRKLVPVNTEYNSNKYDRNKRIEQDIVQMQ